MHVDELQISQLRLLEAIGRTGVLSSAAAEAGLSQSAASHSLARLRIATGDPLFVRTRERMQPTPYGEQLCEAAHGALQLLREGVRGVRSFDAASSRRIFTLFMSEAGQIVLLPALLAFLRDAAPGVRLRVSRVPETNPGHALELGEVDLAIGHITSMTTGFHQRVLLKEEYACLACRDNARFRDGMSLEAYRSAPHAIADSSGMAHWIVDRELDLRGIKRQIGLVVPEFLALPFVLPGSELVATVPRRVADRFAQLLPLKTMSLPIELAAYDVLMLWHERAHADAANRWLRHTLADLFARA